MRGIDTVLRHEGMGVGIMAGGLSAIGAGVATDALPGEPKVAGLDARKVAVVATGAATFFAGGALALRRASNANNMAFLRRYSDAHGDTVTVNYMPRPRSEVLGFDSSFDQLPQEVAFARRMQALSERDSVQLAASRGMSADDWNARFDGSFDLARGLGVSGALAAGGAGISLLAPGE